MPLECERKGKQVIAKQLTRQGCESVPLIWTIDGNLAGDSVS